MSHDGSPNDVRVPGVHDQPDNVSAIFQSDVAPGAAGIIAAPDAAEAFADVAAHGILPFSGIDDLFVGGGDGYGPDGAAEIFIGYIFPVVTAVCRLPDAAAGGAEVEGVALAQAAGYCGTAATAPGADEAVVDPGEEDGICIGKGRGFRSTRLGGQARTKRAYEGDEDEVTHAMKLRLGMKYKWITRMGCGQKKSPACAGGLATATSFSLGLRVRTKSGRIIWGRAQECGSGRTRLGNGITCRSCRRDVSLSCCRMLRSDRWSAGVFVR